MRRIERLVPELRFLTRGTFAHRAGASGKIQNAWLHTNFGILDEQIALLNSMSISHILLGTCLYWK